MAGRFDRGNGDGVSTAGYRQARAWPYMVAMPKRLGSSFAFHTTRAPMSTLIRPASPTDIAAIAAIYRPEVLNGTATYEVDPPDDAEFARRIDAVHAAGLPWLVCEIDGHVGGYAYAGPFRPRASYRWSIENSVYVASDQKGRGIGRSLLTQLIDEVTARGFRQMVAVIGDNTNMASIRLHEAHGFTPVGVHQAIAFKHGKWLDSLHMQRALGAGRATPPDMLPLPIQG